MIFALPFLAGLLFSVFFYVGLPFDFTTDYVTAIGYAHRFDFRELVTMTLNPFTPGWFFVEDMVYLRPLMFLYFKVNESIFGPGAISFEIIEALCCGLVSALLFYLGVKASGSKFYGWLGVTLFLSFPSMFFSTMSFPHIEYLNTLLRLMAVILFGHLTLGSVRTKTGFMIACGLCALFVFLAVKLRSADKILPPFFIAFLALNFRPVLHRLGRVRYAALLGLSLLMMISVVPLPVLWGARDASQPLTGADRKEIKIRTFQTQNVYRNLIHNPEGDFPFTTLSKDKPPLSLTESYGFFLGWGFWLSLAATPFLLRRFRGIHPPELAGPRLQFLKHFYKLLGLFTLCFAVLFGSDMAAADLRYLSFILTPSVPLFVYSISLVESRIFFKNQEKCTGRKNYALACFRLGVLSCFLFTVITNLGFFLKYLGHFGGGMTWGFVRAVETVYEDHYGAMPRGRELYLKSGELFNNNLGIDWHDSWPEILKKRYEGTVIKGSPLYILSQSPVSPDLPLTAPSGFLTSSSMIAEVNFLDAPPLAFRILKAAKTMRNKQNKHKIYIHKVSPFPAPSALRSS